MQHHLKISHFYFAIIYSGLLLLSALAQANPCNEGIGGTGNAIETEGLGGTGISAKSDGLGGTGIVGVITGFASVCVNGVEAHFDSNTKVDIDGVASSVDKLNVGELVAIDAKGQGAQVAAQRISVVHAIVGRVDTMSSTRQQITVLGRQVELSAITQGVNNLKVGQNVAISGFVNASASIQAVRIDKVADNVPALVTGPLLNGKILGVPVDMASSHQVTANVQASGNWDGKTLTVVDVKQNAMDRVMHAGYAFNAQGVVYQNSNSQALYTLGKPVYIDASTKVYGNKNLNNALVIVRGQVDSDGRAQASYP